MKEGSAQVLNMLYSGQEPPTEVIEKVEFLEHELDVIDGGSPLPRDIAMIVTVFDGQEVVPVIEETPEVPSVPLTIEAHKTPMSVDTEVGKQVILPVGARIEFFHEKSIKTGTAVGTGDPGYHLVRIGDSDVTVSVADENIISEVTFEEEDDDGVDADPDSF